MKNETMPETRVEQGIRLPNSSKSEMNHLNLIFLQQGLILF